MKAVRAAFALLLAPTVLTAQEPIAPGVWLVGGNARLAGLHDRANDQDEFGFELAPAAGIFIFRGLALGAEFRLGWSTRESVGRVLSYGIGPTVTYYISAIQSRLYPYAALRTLWVRADFNPSSDAPLLEPSQDTDWVWTAAAGAAVFLARNAALTGELFYSRARFVFEGTQRQENSSDLYGLQFGVRVFIY